MPPSTAPTPTPSRASAAFEPLSIHVTAVEPGRVRTDFAGRSARRAEAVIADYADTMGTGERERRRPWADIAFR